MTLSVSRFVYDSWASCFSWHEICSTCVLDMSCLYVHLPKLVNLHLTLKWKKLRWRYLLGIKSSAFLQRPYCTSSIHRSVYRSICTANSYQTIRSSSLFVGENWGLPSHALHLIDIMLTKVDNRRGTDSRWLDSRQKQPTIINTSHSRRLALVNWHPSTETFCQSEVQLEQESFIFLTGQSVALGSHWSIGYTCSAIVMDMIMVIYVRSNRISLFY